MSFASYTYLTRATVCGVLLTVAGCAGLGAALTPEEQVRLRAQERRDAMVKGDLASVYSYFAPGYRAAVSLDAYRNGMGKALQLVAAKVEFITCETLEKCVVKTKVEIKPLAQRRFAGTITTYSDETWLFESGQWWFFQKL